MTLNVDALAAVDVRSGVDAVSGAEVAAPRAPPGLWRVLGPALVTWGIVAVAIAFPGSWRVLSGVGVLFGVTLLFAVCFGANTVARAAAAFGAVLAALLLIVGVRIGVGDYHRASSQLNAAVEAGSQTTLRVQLTDFATLKSTPSQIPGSSQIPESSQPQGQSLEPVSGWVPGLVVDFDRETPVVVWFQNSREASDTHREVEEGGDTQERAAPALWAPGTVLQVSGSVVGLEPTSSAAYGIRVTEFATESAATGPSKIAAELRAELRAAAGRVPGAALVPGFAVGDTALVSETLATHMKASSLTHLVAVSGANCALLTTAVVWVLSWLGCGRRVRVVCAALTLLAFVVVVGPDASVQRAAVMGAVLLASNFGGKRSAALPALGIAIAVLLIADPWQAWQPGFALSVAATGGILLCAQPFTHGLRRLTRIPLWLALPTAVAAAAQLACGPLLLLLQDGIPAAGLLANVIAGPAAPLGTALGLLALLAGPISTGLAHTLVVAASLPAQWVEETARITSQLPGARWEWVAGVPGALLLTAVQATAITAWLLIAGKLTATGARVIRPWQPSVKGSKLLRTIAAVLIGVSAGVFLGPTVIAPTVQHASVPHDWRVVACDVGQGDAVLLRGPEAAPGEAILVDVGDDEALLRECFAMFGITRIALLVLTHDDRDHIGAISAAAPLTDAVLVAPATREMSSATGMVSDRPLLETLTAEGVAWHISGAGDAGHNAGVDWEILSPRLTSAPVSNNDASLVMRAEAGELSVLLLGDTGETSQAQLMASPRVVADKSLLEVDVVKVAHHGSRDQHPRMYDAARASIGILSVGAGNGYGHPSRDVIAALQHAGTTPVRSDELGSIAISEAGPVSETRPRTGGGGAAGAGADQTPSPRVWTSRGRDVVGDE